MLPSTPWVLALVAAVVLAGCRSVGPPAASVQPSVAGSEQPPSGPTLEPYAGAQAVIPVALGPRGVAFADGAVWVASTRGDLIQRVDTTTNEVVGEISPGERPVTLVTLDGALWASLLNGDPATDDEVVRLDPATGSVEHRVNVPVHHNITVGGGAIWVVDATGQLRRVDGQDGTVTDAVPTGLGPVAIAANDVAVWGIRGNGTAWRHPIDGGELLEASLSVAVPGRSRVAVGDGAVLVAVPGAVLALDPDSLDLRAELALPEMSLVNDLLVTGSDAWLSANVESERLGLDGGSVLRLDAATLEIVAALRLGPESSGVTVAEGSVWAVDQSDHRLARFPLPGR